MNEQDQQIAIAEACGWQDVIGYDDGKVIGLSPEFTEAQCPEGSDEYVPDYLHDLNAMHEAEKLLDDKSEDIKSLYLDWLRLGMDPDDFLNPFKWDWFRVRATAAQRAEAFLRTIGQWKDETKSAANGKET